MRPIRNAAETSQKLPWIRLNNPSIQILLASACLFFNPGLYQTITLLGAGGGRTSSTTMANISNGVLYGVFTFSAIGAGPLLNLVGPRCTLLLGITGYPVFQSAMWYYDETGHLWYPVAAGAYLGLTAGALWTTAAFTTTAYPEERDKGRWRSIQWSANVMGSAIGAAVALSISWNANSEGVPRSVYAVFIALECCSAGFALRIQDPKNLRRSDGTKLAEFDHVALVDTLKITGKLFKDWRILLLLPCMFTPEMFFPFQASLNAYAFNLRTRILNSMLNNLIQVPTALLLGYILDNEKLGTRRKRTFIAIAFDIAWITTAYVAQTVWLASWKFDRSVHGPGIDCTDRAYAGAALVYILYAGQYGIFLNTVVYILASLTNEPRKSAAIGGLCLGVLSSGAAISFGVDATRPRYDHENAAYFTLTMLCWPILGFAAWKFVSDTNYLIEPGVVAPVHVQHELAVAEHAISLHTEEMGIKPNESKVVPAAV